MLEILSFAPLLVRLDFCFIKQWLGNIRNICLYCQGILNCPVVRQSRKDIQK